MDHPHKAAEVERASQIRAEVLAVAVEGVEAPRTGRPLKLTPLVEQTICRHLELGGTVEAACRLADVAVSSFWSWQATAARAVQLVEAGDTLGATEERALAFLGAVSRARARAEAWALGELHRATKDVEDSRGNLRRGDWRAAAFVLERSQPSRWGQKAEVRHVDSGGEQRRRVVIERREGARGTRTVEAEASELSERPGAEAPESESAEPPEPVEGA